MTLTNLGGYIPLMQDIIRRDTSQPAMVSTAIMDASTEKVTFLGCVWHPTVHTGTINIRKIHFRCGAVTFNAASVLQVSLQNISATAGPPYQPDGGADQTVTMTTLSANALNSTGNLSADRAVDLSADSLGDANSRWLAVVFEYTTFTAADSVVISGNGNTALGNGRLIGGATLLNTGSWATLSSGPVVILECDDGTFAFLEGGVSTITFSAQAINTGSAIRKAGCKFKFPVEVKINKLGMLISGPNGADGKLVLYDTDGTTELVAVDVDNDAVFAASDSTFAMIAFQPVTLLANTFYEFVFVPTSATSTSVYYGDVSAVGHMDGMMLGQNLHWVQMDSGNVRTPNTLRRPWVAFGICAVHDGGGGSNMSRVQSGH